MLGSPKGTVKRARSLRRTMSLPEVLLWRALRGRPYGLKFRRQHPAGDYVIDFFCLEAGLGIEVDGVSHDMGDRPERDMARDAWLLEQGAEVLRIPARDVLDDLDAVVRHIVAAVRRRR
ncbi:endonuclease domain-containing protein [Sphingomonas colocasiae]|uniref:Endonuclease domain-containing protein n=1 Tax=Sphingomonas colocasiae TaxID=1848973 RepID=A0ABS7PLB9_9SPHN|nr:endonuclease domain-containing protein [Sphingomonas colocasiae]MBY8822031.1 endonuclease domain-containing protein [Sphingomonas colocasiae]